LEAGFFEPLFAVDLPDFFEADLAAFFAVDLPDFFPAVFLAGIQ
jgi:hypothetical protein